MVREGGRDAAVPKRMRAESLMRMIVLLVALLLVALLVARQIGTGPPAPQVDQTRENRPSPQTPTRPQDVRRFSKDMDRFMRDSAQRRREEIEKQTR